MSTTIFKTLKKLGLTSEHTRTLYNDRTRDVKSLKVWKDNNSEIIYIDDFYTGDETYIDGSYRSHEINELGIKKPDYDSDFDAKRRFKANLELVKEKRVGDFGCGSGDFLRLVKPYCTSVVGVELQKNYIDSLNSEGILCLNNLDSIDNNSLDVILSFHVLEHLPDPLDTLEKIKSKVVSGGKILIEVPHARDFLLSTVECDPFKQFTLWSQHLVLHTRESLKKMLEFVGLVDIQIEGVQRYPLSNHLYWILNGEPGGHKSHLLKLDSEKLFEAYSCALEEIDETDTLVAVAKVP